MNLKNLFSSTKKVDSPLQKKDKYRMSDAAFYALLSSILAVFVLYVVYFLQSQTVAGGEKTVMRMDLYHQYGPLYAELYDRLTSGESLLYSWNTGLGSSFVGNFFNYCCSPFTLLILLFGHYNIPEAIAVIILLKGACAAASFTYFINRVYGTRRASIGFGLLYAFCGYFVAYSWNIMWLDAFLMFPMVMLGIVFIIRRGKPSLYIAALAYTMFTNYYMAYMVCILSVIYFLYFYFSHYSLKTKLSETVDAEEDSNGYFSEFRNSRFMMTGFKFALGSLLSFMLTAFALIPVYYILTGSSATNSSGAPKIDAWKDYFNIFDFLANHLANLSPTIRSSGDDVLPNVYCGIIVLFLVPAFIFSKKITKKRKVLTCGMLGIFYASFSLNFLNYIWHGMHYPNDLPYRYSFAYSFLLLILAYEAFLHIREYSGRFFIGTGVGILAFIVLVQELGSKNVGKFTLMTNIVLVIAMAAILAVIAEARIKRDTVALVLTCFIIAELSVANTGNYVMSQSKEAYAGDYYAFQDISATVEEYENANDAELFYREERSKLLTRMDASWMDYNGISVFSSMAYETTAKLHRAFGLFSNGINSYTYNPQTAVYNSMFGIKYIYDKNDLIHDENMYSFVANNDTFTAYEYNYNLPFIFSVNADLAEWEAYGGQNPFYNQNSYFESATGVEEVLENIVADDNVSTTGGLTVNTGSLYNGSFSFDAGSSEGTATIVFTAEQAGDVTIYFKSPQCLGYNISADNGTQYSTRQSGGSTVYFSLNVGYLEAGQSAKLVLTYPANTDGTASVYAVRLNEEKFLEGYNRILENGTFELTAFEESYFEGTINVTNENALLYTSVPYDKSWIITVDGTQLSQDQIRSVADALIVIPIGQGEHTVSFSYEPQGLKLGLLISGIGFLILLLCLIISLISKKKRENNHPMPCFFIPADDTDMHTFEEVIPADEPEGKENERKQTSVLWKIIFCYLSFGIYYFVWKNQVFTDVKKFAKKYGNWNEKSGLAFLFAPIYAPYWISSRSKKIAAAAEAYGIHLEAQSKWRFLLGFFGGGFFALGELADDLNFFYKHIEEAQIRLQSIQEDGFEALGDEADTADELTLNTEDATDNHKENDVCTEKQIFFTKKTDFLIKIITVGLVFFFMCASYLGIQLAASSAEDETTTTTVTTTASTRITVPSTITSTTEKTTVTTTESTTVTTTQPETTTVLNNELMAEAARTLLRFTGIELNDKNSILILVSANAESGDSIQTLCERHGIDSETFTTLIVMLNDLPDKNYRFSKDELVILPMVVSAENTSESLG